jgi:hypothetical protein
MSELLHTLEHTLGLCGEKHLSVLSALVEYPNVYAIFNYIKALFK